MGIDGGRTDCLRLHERTDRRRGARGRERHDGRGRHLLREDRQQLLLDQQRGTHNRIHINQNRTTMNKQQTAVEWLVEQFKEYDFADVKDTENYIIKMQSFVLTEKLEKAKEMDKIQKFHMFNCGRQYQLTGEGTFKQVYQETYGGGEQ